MEVSTLPERSVKVIGKSQCTIMSVSCGAESEAYKFSQHKNHEHSAQCAQLRNEAELLLQFEHPHVVSAFGFHEDVLNSLTGTVGCVLQMEQARCDYLHHFNALHPELRSRKEMLAQIARALQFLHARGVAHNDVKPENVLVFEDGVYKLADLGYAGCFAGSVQQQRARWARRAVQTLSPELLALQTDPQQVVDEFAADAFAFGVMAFVVVLGGLYPFAKKAEREKDLLFRHIHHKNYPVFWNQPPIARKLRRAFPNDKHSAQSFRNLIEKTLCSAEERLSFKEIVHHPFFEDC